MSPTPQFEPGDGAVSPRRSALDGAARTDVRADERGPSVQASDQHRVAGEPKKKPKPRRLRLSAIITQIRDEVAGRPSAAPKKEAASASANAGPGANAPAPPPVDPNSELAGGNRVTLGEIVDRTQEAGFGFLVAFMAIGSMPFPGLSVPFGVAIAYGAVQMIIGLHRPWLPKFLRRRELSVGALDRIGGLLTRWMGWLEVVVRPRLTFMVRGPGWILCGIVLLGLAIGLSLPLPIPFSNFIFVIPIMLYAIALLENDGLIIILAHLVVANEVMLVIRSWDDLLAALHKVIAWWMGG